MRSALGKHTWHALGGNQSPPNPAAWGAADANECVDKVIKSGRYWTPKTWGTDPPVGAWVGYKYGSNGHAALRHKSAGNIATTDPSDSSVMVGVEKLNYPNKWGASGWDVWTDQYNGSRFPVGITNVYLSKFVYEQRDSDSVRHLQGKLNSISLSGGEELPITGNYLDQTADEVSKWQQQKAKDKSVTDGLTLTEEQAKELFPTDLFLIVDDLEEEETDPDAPPVEEGWYFEGLGLWKWYSGKPSGDFVLHPDGEWHKLKLVQPASGITEESSEHHFLYLRVELPVGRSADRVLETKFVRSDGDATAYDSEEYGLKKDSHPYYNIHFEDGSGLGGEWYVKVTGGTDPIRLTTRYAKTHIIYVKEQEL